MKTFTSEDLKSFVKEHLASGEGVVKCHSINTPNNRQQFICLKEAIICKMDWRGSELALKAGDFIHADPNDFYPLTAKQFAKCFVIIN